MKNTGRHLTLVACALGIALAFPGCASTKHEPDSEATNSAAPPSAAPSIFTKIKSADDVPAVLTEVGMTVFDQLDTASSLPTGWRGTWQGRPTTVTLYASEPALSDWKNWCFVLPYAPNRVLCVQVGDAQKVDSLASVELADAIRATQAGS